MFFQHLMTIRDGDLVLEVGPGAYPHWRSDCLVDKFDNESDTDVSQFGGLPQRTLGKPLFRMKDNIIPFRDNTFDYVICSHVLEHVHHEELSGFLSEIMRVGRRAYIEFPRTLFDYIYDFDVHLNLMDIVDGEIICLPKKYTHLEDVKRFSSYALEMRKKSGFAVEKIGSATIAVGREFHGNIPLRIYEDEDAFFARLDFGESIIGKAGFGWKVTNRIKMALSAFAKKQSREYFEGLLK